MCEVSGWKLLNWRCVIIPRAHYMDRLIETRLIRFNLNENDQSITKWHA